jgi:hypothetical protein
MKDFLIFSKRLKLAEKVNSYIAEKGITMDAFGVVSVLSSLGLLDTEACKKYLDSKSETFTDADKRFNELHDRMSSGEATTEELNEYMGLAKEKYK